VAAREYAGPTDDTATTDESKRLSSSARSVGVSPPPAPGWLGDPGGAVVVMSLG
jgi:hypothetical protein